MTLTNSYVLCRYPTANVSAGEEVTSRPDTAPFEDVVGDGTVIFLSATIMQNGSSLADVRTCGWARERVCV